MSVKELYMLCGNWLPNTTVAVYSKSTRTIKEFTYYQYVIDSYGDKLVDNFLLLSDRGIICYQCEVHFK